MARYNYEDPNAIRYNSQSSLLPNLVQVPKEAPAQLSNQLTEWAKEQGAQRLAMLGLGVPLALGGVIPTIRYGISNSPKVQTAIMSLGNLPIGRNIVEFGKAAANNPVVQKADKTLTKFIDWIF